MSTRLRGIIFEQETIRNTESFDFAFRPRSFVPNLEILNLFLNSGYFSVKYFLPLSEIINKSSI